MRGKATARVLLRWQFGITPAYAGKSPFPAYLLQRSRDHPRLCGEKGIWNELADTAVGSPPPMRGKVPETVS